MPLPILFPIRRPIQDANALGVGPFMRGMMPKGVGGYLTIYGVTKNSSGAVLGSCVVDLFRTVDDVRVDTVVSNATTGAYEFRGVAGGQDHYLVAYKVGAPDVAGTTVNYLIGGEPASGIIAKSYEEEVLADLPIWHSLLLPGDATVIDEIGTLDGSYVNTPTLGAPGPLLLGATSYGVTLNGTDEYITIPDDAVIDQGNGPFSWEIWFKKAAAGSSLVQSLMMKSPLAPVLQLYNGGAGDHYIEFYALSSGSQACHSSARFGNIDWHHLVGTKDESNVWLIYADGVEGTIVETPNTVSASTSGALEIGRRHDDSRYFNGTVALPALYNSTLSAERIAAHRRAAGY